MKKIIWIPLVIILIDIFINCSISQIKQPFRSIGVSKNAIWSEKQNIWVLKDLDGTVTFWYPNGNKYSFFKLINHKYEGLFVKWYENGNKEMEGKYKNDLLEGLWKTWWPNGQLKTKGNYINSKLDGLWEGYDENGELFLQEIYKDGVKISEKDFTKEKKE